MAGKAHTSLSCVGALPMRTICSCTLRLCLGQGEWFGSELNSSLEVAQGFSPCFVKDPDGVPWRGPPPALLRGVCGQRVLGGTPQHRVPEHADVCGPLRAPRGLRGLEEAGERAVR